MSILDRDYFRDEASAYAKLESVLWPQGPECPKCGVVNDAHKITANTAKKVRHGLYRCNACKAQFTVTVGTVFESSHIPLHKWLQAAHLLNSSKKGISAKQIERTLQITYKSAWFMMHRLRVAMDPIFQDTGRTMGGEGKTLEMDETYIGQDPNNPRKKGARGYKHKMAVFSLVERGGEVRSFHIDWADKELVSEIVRQNADRKSRHFTDGHAMYKNNGMQFEGGHDWVDHSREEYGRGEVHTNTIEGFFSIFKRGMKGIYQHCSEKHLDRYLAEFDFRYNNREALGTDDVGRTDNALKGAKGKRLTYRGPDLPAEAA
jgi:transposase-like protein